MTDLLSFPGGMHLVLYPNTGEMFSSESVPGLLLRGRRRTWAHTCLFPSELRESWNKSWSIWPGTLLPSSAQTDASWSGPWLSWHNHGHLWAACSLLLAHLSSQPLPKRHLNAAAGCFLLSMVCRDVLLQGRSFYTYCFLMHSAIPSWNCSSASEQLLYFSDIAGLAFQEHMVIQCV